MKTNHRKNSQHEFLALTHHYVYAVLHDPAYRKKYELNLKREFPRIPFYDDFRQWANWGKRLMNLHVNYETVKPYRFSAFFARSIISSLMWRSELVILPNHNQFPTAKQNQNPNKGL